MAEPTLSRPGPRHRGSAGNRASAGEPGACGEPAPAVPASLPLTARLPLAVSPAGRHRSRVPGGRHRRSHTPRPTDGRQNGRNTACRSLEGPDVATPPPGWPERIVLASASPRRRQLLAQLGVQFEVRPAALDETPLPDEDARAHVERLAIAKATAVAAPAEVVLAADTTVELDGRIFGKPTDTDHALDMLRLLRGPPRRPRGSRGAGRRPPPRVEDRAGEHRRAHGVQGVLERGDHPEVAAAAAQRPEQVRVLLRAGVRTSCPSAVTRPAPTRLSEVRPQRRTSQPSPPPRVNPAIPVVDTTPPVTASPKACVSWSRSLHRQPACATTRRDAGSTRMPFMGERSRTTPPSVVEKPGMLWPPPRTASGSPSLRANSTPRTTSDTPAQRMMSAGRASCAAFQIDRAWSYCSLAGVTSSPCRASAS